MDQNETKKTKAYDDRYCLGQIGGLGFGWEKDYGKVPYLSHP